MIFILFYYLLEAPYTQCNGIGTAVLIASGTNAFGIQIKHGAPSNGKNMDTFKSSVAGTHFAVHYL